MRTMVIHQQAVKLIAPTFATGALGSKTATYTGTPTTVNATVQPISSARVLSEYGARADRMKLLLLPPDTTVAEDYGVWLAADNTGLAPWIVVTAKAWSTHIECHIERCDGVGL